MIQNFAKMEEISINNIEPAGWYRDFLITQAEGLTGHIEAAGYPFNKYRWDNFKEDINAEKRGGASWWPYEQTGYWYDGAEKCAELLNNDKLRAIVNKAIDYLVENKDKSGYLGPEFLKSDDASRWAHVVFFRTLMAKYSATGDKKILDLLKNHYDADQHKYDSGRDVLNVEIILWLYLQTKENKWLELAEKSFASYNEKKEDEINLEGQKSRKALKVHGVSFNEYSKLGAILYICTGKKEYLEPVIAGYKKADRYQMLVDGLHSSEEMMWNNNYLRAHETCNVSDYTWTLGYLLMATGDGKWADKIERCIFNAGIGSVDEEFKALQYFSSPNQLIANRTSNRCRYYRGDGRMSYAPNPGTECCVGNVNRFFPNYCSRMWMKKGDDIFAVFYGDSKLKIDGMIIKETTEYPFDDKISFEFILDKKRQMKFYMRIPSWCEKSSISVNGTRYEFSTKKGFATIEREFSNGDKIELSLPSDVQVCDYHSYGTYIEKGPLVYAYGMYGKREIVESDGEYSKDFPVYDIYPDSAWNYSLSTQKTDKISFKKKKISGNPWDIRFTPCKIEVPARKVNGWELERHNRVKRYKTSPLINKNTEILKGDFVFTPKLPSKAFIKEHGLGEEEMISLVPMASAKLRLTIFPKED